MVGILPPTRYETTWDSDVRMLSVVLQARYFDRNVSCRRKSFALHKLVIDHDWL